MTLSGLLGSKALRTSILCETGQQGTRESELSLSCSYIYMRFSLGCTWLKGSCLRLWYFHVL